MIPCKKEKDEERKEKGGAAEGRGGETGGEGRVVVIEYRLGSQTLRGLCPDLSLHVIIFSLNHSFFICRMEMIATSAHYN